MPFDNFYKESDNAARLWWKCLGGAVLVVIGYCSLFFILPDPQPVEIPPKPALSDSVSISNTINQDAVQRLNELCAGLPQPEKFDFKGSGNPRTLNNNYSFVEYRYSSKRSPDEIIPIFLVWFNENGWERAPNTDSTFKKGNKTVYISSAPESYGSYFIYEILCGEKIAVEIK